MYDNAQFEQLVSVGNPTGEVVGLERFLVRVKGLNGAAIGSLVLFQTGQRGIIREVGSTTMLVLNLNSESMPIGTIAVLQELTFTTPVGESLLGRVVNPLGAALDGKGDIAYEGVRDVFSEAPGIMERSLLSDQLVSGVSMVDMLFPIVLGQRIAVMGDTKTGKSSFLAQLGINQLGSDRVVVYVMIGKRRTEVDQLIATLEETGAIAQSIVVVASVFDSLAQSYVAPYVGCAIAEYLWLGGRDVVIVYDDLSSHAKIHREVSLLAHVNPGRESYPGDMFFAHSTLLERAGKLSRNNKTLTALPVVITPGDDITAYLPTSIMSITDGQIIFDLATFRRNIRPAVNTGLSVSRVGGRVQSSAQKALTGTMMQRLAAYRQAQEFSHFGSDLSEESRQILELGRQLHEMLRQPPTELRSLFEQQLLLKAVIDGGGRSALNIQILKDNAKSVAETLKTEDDIDAGAKQIHALAVIGGTE